eukprot:SAG31_NODE_692_length_12772_cov_15.543044_2_plen_202_part_00
MIVHDCDDCRVLSGYAGSDPDSLSVALSSRTAGIYSLTFDTLASLGAVTGDASVGFAGSVFSFLLFCCFAVVFVFLCFCILRLLSISIFLSFCLSMFIFCLSLFLFFFFFCRSRCLNVLLFSVFRSFSFFSSCCPSVPLSILLVFLIFCLSALLCSTLVTLSHIHSASPAAAAASPAAAVFGPLCRSALAAFVLRRLGRRK